MTSDRVEEYLDSQDLTEPPDSARFIHVGGQRLRVAIRRGDGQHTPLLLFHSIAGNLELLQPFVDALDPAIEVIRFDIPGSGESSGPLVPYRFSMLAGLVERMLDQLGYNQVDVLGVSWGGALAQHFAYWHYQRCRRLILVSTSTGALMVTGDPGILGILVSPRRRSDDQFREATAARLYGGLMRSNPKLVHEYDTIKESTGGRGFLYHLFSGLGWTSLPWVAFIQQPTLIISGDDDPLVPLPNARILYELIPNSQLYVYHGGHGGLLVQARELAAVVARFLEQPAPTHGVVPAMRHSAASSDVAHT